MFGISDYSPMSVILYVDTGVLEVHAASIFGDQRVFGTDVS
jgi:hypothetical protein